MCTDLFKRSIRQLQDVNNRDEAAIRLNNWQIEIMSIYTQENDTLSVKPHMNEQQKTLAVHFLERILYSHRRWCNIRVGRHDPDYTTSSGLKACSDNTQDDIFACENTSDTGCCSGAPVLSITHTAVVRFSFMRRAASFTVVFGPTVAG